METCDAVIVGGGPAGSSCARRFRGAGLDVILLDKAEFPRDKPCGGWVTPPVLEALEIDPLEYAKGRTIQPICGFRTGTVGGPEIETPYGRPVSFGILRREFDHYLLERCGARLRTGTAVTSLRREDSRWIVNEEIAAPLLIGAGGHFCPVARLLNGSPRPDQIVAAQEMERLMEASEASRCRIREDVPELYFSPDMNGYGWCFRKGDCINVGFGRRGPERLSSHVDSFLAFLKERGKIPADFSYRGKGHAYLLYETPAPRRLVGDGVALIGDAAGLADAATGEGIRPAVDSGLVAAETVLAARGRYARADLQAYQARLETRLGRRPGRTRLPAPVVRFVGARLLSSRWFTRRVLLDGWFLHAGARRTSPDAAKWSLRTAG